MSTYLGDYETRIADLEEIILQFIELFDEQDGEMCLSAPAEDVGDVIDEALRLITPQDDEVEL